MGGKAMEKYRLNHRWSYPQRAEMPLMLLHLDSYQNPVISWTCCDISFVLSPYWACSNSSMILHCDFSCATSVCHSALVPQSRNDLKCSIIPVFFSAFCPSRPLFLPIWQPCRSSVFLLFKHVRCSFLSTFLVSLHFFVSLFVAHPLQT